MEALSYFKDFQLGTQKDYFGLNFWEAHELLFFFFFLSIVKFLNLCSRNSTEAVVIPIAN